MKLRGKGVTLTNGVEASPPLPFIEVENSEAEGLLAEYGDRIEVVDGGEAVVEGSGETESGASEPPAGGSPSSDAAPTDASVKGAAKSTLKAKEAAAPATDPVSAGDILEAVDLLDEGVEPTPENVGEVLGKAVTTEELAAALATREGQ